MEAFFDVCVPSEGQEGQLSQDAAYRLLCHVLVQHLPEAAFGEAFEALNGMYEFYQERPKRLTSLSISPVQASLTGTITAPVYPVSED
jgi:hypothetical protein